jgi:outer membrane biosynthesis protein TonB
MTTAEFTIDNGGDEAAERKNARAVLLAFLGALLLHLIVGFSLAAWNGVFAPTAPVEEKPIELTFVDQSTPAPIAPKNANFIETDESKKAPEPREKTFESNANSIGASEIGATGQAPIPSQQGKDQPFMNLETHDYALGNDSAQPRPSVAPMETPKPAETPVATPEPDQLALLRNTPTPVPTARATPRQPASAYRSQQQRTMIHGNISNHGISSVNALGTPLGRYQKLVSETIGSKWYSSISQVQDMFLLGTARLVFWVDRNGEVKDLKVVQNSNNEAFANYCIQSVREAKLPPMPDDLAATLPPEGLLADFPFTIYTDNRITR